MVATSKDTISEHQKSLEVLKASHAKNLDEAHDRAITAEHTTHVAELEQLQASHINTIAALEREHATSQEAAFSDVEKRKVSLSRFSAVAVHG